MKLKYLDMKKIMKMHWWYVIKAYVDINILENSMTERLKYSIILNNIRK